MWKKFLGALIFSSCFLVANISEATDIRIALVEGQNTAAIAAANAFKVKDLLSGAERELPKGKYYVHIQDGSLKLEEQGFGKYIELQVEKGKSLPMLNGRSYDGVLQLRVVENKLLVTNTLELEQLLCRILPSKTMPVWPDEAIKAQAVAARTYMLYQKENSYGKGYDLKANDKEAPYAGVGQRVEKPAISKLIKATAGQYLADAANRPIFAVSTSSTGGKTEKALEALGKDYSYLQSVKDYDEDSPEFKWDFRISPDYVVGLLAQNGYSLGKLVNVRISSFKEPGGDRTTTGRVKYIIFGGSLGTVKLSGQRAAELFNLNSSCFEVEAGTPVPEKIHLPVTNAFGMEIGKKEVPIKVREEEPKIWSEYVKRYHVLTGGKDERLIFHGRGKGLGVGLSAWGARGMASGTEPKKYEEILAHYYTGAKLVK